ncbi:MAG: bacillithiol biosynthesis deacetylase BshB1 [Gorillibacterium sp.]|nr:bacillithiol biosynthesis deacetylase BshB1 [Gorillibacterium sp.]
MSQGLDLLVFGAHADDAEIGMGATIVKHIQAGYRVAVCDLTYSEMSSNGTVELRKQEAAKASDILGLTERSCLGLPDRGLFCSAEQIEAVAMEIRRLRPRIVFAPYWVDRHPDHVMCGQIVEQAVFSAKLRRYRPDVLPVTVENVYYYFINEMGKVDFMLDVSSFYDQKLLALSAYSSQFAAPSADHLDIVATPLNQGYLERVKLRDQMLGMKQQLAYAEGFASKTTFITDLIL